MPLARRFAAVLSLTCFLVGALLAKAVTPGFHDDTPPAAPAATYQQAVDEYFAAKWDDLDTTLHALSKAPQGLTDAQRADLHYLSQTLLECHPHWWKATKANQKTPLQVNLWGHTMNLIFDPNSKSGIQISSSATSLIVTVKWEAADMDNPAQAEHGYTKGELTNLGIWNTLGTVEAWLPIPQSSQVNMKDDARLMLTRYLDFRGDITGVYYGEPGAARRWGLWLYSAGYMEKYAKMQTDSSRKAVGAMFVAEVVSHPERYPSIEWPKTLDAENAESKMALALKDRIEHHGWTLAEDKALRDVTKAFATANGRNVLPTGLITLPSKLQISLDPDHDVPLQAKRDAWVKTQFDKNNKSEPPAP